MAADPVMVEDEIEAKVRFTASTAERTLIINFISSLGYDLEDLMGVSFDVGVPGAAGRIAVTATYVVR